jgi:hypothetical protein
VVFSPDGGVVFGKGTYMVALLSLRRTREVRN